MPGAPDQTPGPSAHVALLPTEFPQIPGWGEDDHAAAFKTFRAGMHLIADEAPKTRSLGIDGTALQRVAPVVLRQPANLDRAAAKAFFERYFLPHRIDAPGFVTGYYEPEVAASQERTKSFVVPLYRRPPDLVEVDERERPAGWDPEMRFARQTDAGPAPYFDRPAIEAGALAGRGLELAWLRDPVDAFFIHVQGLGAAQADRRRHDARRL